MEMRQYLIDTFLFNDTANKKQLQQIKKLPEPSGAVRYFSHLINSQNKWLKRIIVFPEDPKMDWWEPLYEMDKLEEEWDKSVKAWIEFISDQPDEKLEQERRFVGYDGGNWTVPLKDIALQLNYHSIHHRAQIQMLIRQQGLEPDFLDYIATKYKKLE
jgi:uncharacterized damage-inducible protein DinB